MSREEVREIFLPQFYKVLDLVNGQIQQVNGKFGQGSLKVVKELLTLILARFSRRRARIKYLSPQIPETITSTRRRRQTTNQQVYLCEFFRNCSWSAVVRGAVMYGLNSRIVRERILRRHYGIATSVVWNPEKHPLERRWRDKLDGTWRVDVMKWYVTKVPSHKIRVNGRDIEWRIAKKWKFCYFIILTMMKY